MAMDSQILVSNYGVSAQFAESLLKYTSGDVEGAIRILEASEKDVIALKAKFISSKKMTNGALILFFNFQTNLPEYVYCVISSNQNVGKIKLEGHWKEFVDEVERYLSSPECDPEASSRIESQVLSNDNVKYISSFFVDKSSFDMVNIRRFLLSEISKVLMDTGIVLKVITDFVDVFRFRTYFNETKNGLKIMSQNFIKTAMLINMKIDPILTPIGGLDVEKIQVGDDVLAKVVDTREIVEYIKELSPNKQDGGKSLYGKVVRSVKGQNSDNNILTLEFGPGIFGTLIVGGKVKIHVVPHNKKISEALASDAKPIHPQKETATDWLNNASPPIETRTMEGGNKKTNFVLYIVAGLIAVAAIVVIIVMFML